jgi:hypothetical protein
MIVVLKAGCDLSFTRRYCPQAIEEYEQWGFTFDAHGMNTSAVLEMDIEQITRLIKYFTHREAKYDLSGAGLHYIPNAPYYPGSCLIQVTKFSEGPGTRYWGRDKHEVKYYMRCEEEMRGPQMEKWYITINDEDRSWRTHTYLFSICSTSTTIISSKKLNDKHAGNDERRRRRTSGINHNSSIP